jgi:hypothetical protein
MTEQYINWRIIFVSSLNIVLLNAMKNFPRNKLYRMRHLFEPNHCFNWAENLDSQHSVQKKKKGMFAGLQMIRQAQEHTANVA